MNTLKLEELEIYQLTNEVGEYVWGIVSKWEHFPKQTVGKQFADAADSISANIAEGYGRYHFKERKTFCYYSRGSLMETKTGHSNPSSVRLFNKEITTCSSKSCRFCITS